MRALSLAAGGLAALALAAAGAADVAAGPRRTGRVVRVPRPPLQLSTAVRTCAIVEENRAACSAPVEIGEQGRILDEEGVRGTAVIRTVDPQPDACGNLANWNIELQLQGSVDPPSRGSLVLDYALDERARRLAPDQAPRDGERVVDVIDSDGDGDGDLRTTVYSCDQAGALARSPRPTHQCTDYWLSVRGRWQRARTDRVPVCDR